MNERVRLLEYLKWSREPNNTFAIIEALALELPQYSGIATNKKDIRTARLGLGGANVEVKVKKGKSEIVFTVLNLNPNKLNTALENNELSSENLITCFEKNGNNSYKLKVGVVIDDFKLNLSSGLFAWNPGTGKDSDAIDSITTHKYQLNHILSHPNEILMSIINQLEPHKSVYQVVIRKITTRLYSVYISKLNLKG